MRALLAVLVLALAAVGCEVKFRDPDAPRHAPPKQSRFVIHDAEWRDWDEVVAVCDRHAGNLLYIVRGDSRAAVAVVPGGCAEAK